MTEPYIITGSPNDRTVLVVVDHASNAVPNDIDLQISPDFLNDHIAIDIGVAAIATQLARTSGYLAFMARYSRLVVDLNRYRDEAAVIPLRSDGVEITGNDIDKIQRETRLQNYFDPYHDKLAETIFQVKPALIVGLHSFTNVLHINRSLKRPWDIGIMYNEHETASKLALQALATENLVIGDQKPYSGKDLNATMNRHAEATGTPYFGMEIRQDLISNECGQAKFAEIVMRTSAAVLSGLA